MSLDSLQEEKRYLLSELSLEKEQHQSALAQLTALQRSHAALQEQVADSEQQLQETQVALLNKDKRVHALQRQVAEGSGSELLRENEALRTQIGSLLQERATLKQQVQTQLEAALSDAQLGSSVGADGVAQLRRELAESHTHATRLQKQLDAFKTRASDDAKRSQQRIAELEADVKRKAAALDLLQQSVEAYGQDHAGSKSQSDKAAELEAELRRELATLRGTVERVAAERDSLRLELQSTVDELAAARNARPPADRAPALEAQLGAAQQALARARGDLGELERVRRACEQLEAAVEARDAELASLRAEIAAAPAGLRQKYEALVGELAQTKAALAAAQAEQRSASSRSAPRQSDDALRAELMTTREELNEVRAAEREARAQCVALRQQVDAHVASLQRLASQAERDRKAVRLAHIRATKLQIDELKTIVQTQLLFENRLVSVL
jgi:chemotaxis protein MotB